MPQGTVDNNLGPDRLAGPMALDPNLCLDALTVHGTASRLCWAKALPLLILLMSRI